MLIVIMHEYATNMNHILKHIERGACNVGTRVLMSTGTTVRPSFVTMDLDMLEKKIKRLVNKLKKVSHFYIFCSFKSENQTSLHFPGSKISRRRDVWAQALVQAKSLT